MFYNLFIIVGVIDNSEPTGMKQQIVMVLELLDKITIIYLKLQVI